MKLALRAGIEEDTPTTKSLPVDATRQALQSLVGLGTENSGRILGTEQRHRQDILLLARLVCYSLGRSRASEPGVLQTFHFPIHSGYEVEIARPCLNRAGTGNSANVSRTVQIQSSFRVVFSPN